MDKLAFAEGVIAGKIVLPKDRSSAAQFVYSSIDELRTNPFDPLRLTEYLAVVEEGKQLVGRRRAEEQKRQEDAFLNKVSRYETEIWRKLKAGFVWCYGQKTVELDGAFEYQPSPLQSGPVLSSAGVQYREAQCLAKGRKIELSPHLEKWVREVAERCVRENEPINNVRLIKEMLITNSTLEITCPFANPLIDPNSNYSCSIFRSGSSRAFACDTVKLTLQPK